MMTKKFTRRRSHDLFSKLWHYHYFHELCLYIYSSRTEPVVRIFAWSSAKTRCISLLALRKWFTHLLMHRSSRDLTDEMPKSQTHWLKQTSLILLYVTKNSRNVLWSSPVEAIFTFNLTNFLKFASQRPFFDCLHFICAFSFLGGRHWKL